MNTLPLNYAELETLYAEVCRAEAGSVALTCCTGKAGVSLLVIALAHRAIRDRRSVLLVDFNLASPALHSYFNIARDDWTFVDELWRDSVVQVEEGFDVLCATRAMDAPSFHSEALLKAGLKQFQQDYDLVILDTSPLERRNRHNTPPEIVCGSADVALLCLLTGICTESQLLNATSILQQAQARLLGAVLNDQYAPSLKSELVRETHRLDRYFPRLAGWLRDRLDRMLLLHQSL